MNGRYNFGGRIAAFIIILDIFDRLVTFRVIASATEYDNQKPECAHEYDGEAEYHHQNDLHYF